LSLAGGPSPRRGPWPAPSSTLPGEESGGWRSLPSTPSRSTCIAACHEWRAGIGDAVDGRAGDGGARRRRNRHRPVARAHRLPAPELARRLGSRCGGKRNRRVGVAAGGAPRPRPRTCAVPGERGDHRQTGLPVAYDVDTAADGSEATVRAWTSVDLTLLRLVSAGPLEVSARATVTPLLSP